MAGDLNLKKSWNPALVKNQTKVWEEEQAKLAELKKIRERTQELEKEQEYINLLKLQHGEDFQLNDLSKNEKLKLNKLNWMYEDVPHSKSTKNEAGFIEKSEEFTEGKEKAESLLQGNKGFASRNTSDKISRILSTGTKSEPRKDLADDPLLKIRERQSVHRREKPDRERSPTRKERHKRDRDEKDRDEKDRDSRRSHHRKERSDSHRSSHRSHRSDHKSSSHKSDSNRSESSKSEIIKPLEY